MQLTFVGAKVPLCKTFSLRNGVITSYPYPMVRNVTSYTETVRTIEDFHDALCEHADQGHALYKGHFDRPLKNESRAGRTKLSEPTEWICFDLDGLNTVGSAQSFLEALNIADTDHIVQLSNSTGLKPGVRAHIFMALSAPEHPANLKQWIKYLNLSAPVLKNAITLSATTMSLAWPLDPTVNQNDKLLYIANPKFEVGVRDPLNGAQRITLVKGTRRTLDLSPQHRNVALFSVSETQDRLLNELRSAQGLRKRTFKTEWKASHNVSVTKNATACAVTGVHKARGFVYLNLNGGDSFAYWHPEDNPEVIHTFKDEPAALARELVPDYYADCIRHQREEVAKRSDLTSESAEPKHFVFCDRDTGAYWKGRFTPRTQSVELWPAPKERHLLDFCSTHNLEMPVAIPDWQLVFDPTNPKIFDPERQILNQYSPTIYKVKTEKANAPTEIPKRIRTVISHVLGSDPVAFDHFINWLAYIWQTGKKPKTAWLLHGIPGTGKGVLFSLILRPLFGQAQVNEVTVGVLEDSFNRWLATTQILFIDESDTDKVKNLAKAEAMLKHYITEDTISVRAMRTDHKAMTNFMGIIVASNKRNPLMLDYDDRRFNIPPRQEEKLLQVITEDEIDKIPGELQAFADFLTAVKISYAKIRTPMESDAKLAIQETTTDVPAELVRNILTGNLRYFIDQLPSERRDSNHVIDVALHGYYRVLDGLMNDLGDKDSLVTPMSRDEIKGLFEYLAGGTWKSQSPTKFTKAVSKYGLRWKQVWHHGKNVQGMTVNWVADEETRMLAKQRLKASSLQSVRTDRQQA